jgi:hypothetical protein
MLTDGTVITPDQVKRRGYYGGPESFAPRPVGLLHLWAYAMAASSGFCSAWPSLGVVQRAAAMEQADEAMRRLLHQLLHLVLGGWLHRREGRL